MGRRKASPEQLNMLLHFLEEDKELAVGKFIGIEGRIRQTNAWLKITEKLNANSEFSSGALKTPSKWQQTWRDWRSNVRKKAFKLRKNRLIPGFDANTQLSEAEEKILRLTCNNTSVFGLNGVPETSAVTNSMDPTQSNITTDDLRSDQSTSNLKWPPDPLHLTQADLDMTLEAAVADPDTSMRPDEVTSAPNTAKPLWKRARPIRLVHDRLINLEEEKIRLKKQKLLETKRCNNLRLKMEKDRLEIEKQRNLLLEKLLVAVEAVTR